MYGKWSEPYFLAAAHAVNITQVILEFGAKNSILIDKDSDFLRTAEKSLWHAISNAGQSCIGGEHVYLYRQSLVNSRQRLLPAQKRLSLVS